MNKIRNAAAVAWLYRHNPLSECWRAVTFAWKVG